MRNLAWSGWLALLVACGSESTVTGAGQAGVDGLAGPEGTHCWDVNGDGVSDPGEDQNGDGVTDVLDCAGADGAPGAPGADGATGAAGADGTAGRDGADGLSCWDTNGDGMEDDDEDMNGDGAWTAADCQGESTGGALTKASLYTVTGGSATESIAACDDNDDVLLTGGCRFQESCIPAHFTGVPEYADDASQPAQWRCALNCGSVIAEAVCVEVP